MNQLTSAPNVSAERLELRQFLGTIEHKRNTGGLFQTDHLDLKEDEKGSLTVVGRRNSLTYTARPFLVSSRRGSKETAVVNS